MATVYPPVAGKLENDLELPLIVFFFSFFSFFQFDPSPFAGNFGQFIRITDVAFHIAALHAHEVIQCSDRGYTDGNGVAAKGTFFQSNAGSGKDFM